MSWYCLVDTVSKVEVRFITACGLLCESVRYDCSLFYADGRSVRHEFCKDLLLLISHF